MNIEWSLDPTNYGYDLNVTLTLVLPDESTLRQHEVIKNYDYGRDTGETILKQAKKRLLDWAVDNDHV